MYKANDLTQKEIKELFNYDKEKGILEWRLLSRGRKETVGTIYKSGYRIVGINKDGKYTRYRVHRLIYVLHYGDISSEDQIDHINHLRLDNRVENLRLVTNKGNSRNKPMNSNNKSGFTGVSWNKNSNKWEAYIWNDYKMIRLGMFTAKDDAIDARKKANVKYGFYQGHGEIKQIP